MRPFTFHRLEQKEITCPYAFCNKFYFDLQININSLSHPVVYLVSTHYLSQDEAQFYEFVDLHTKIKINRYLIQSLTFHR